VVASTTGTTYVLTPGCRLPAATTSRLYPPVAVLIYCGCTFLQLVCIVILYTPPIYIISCLLYASPIVTRLLLLCPPGPADQRTELFSPENFQCRENFRVWWVVHVSPHGWVGVWLGGCATRPGLREPALRRVEHKWEHTVHGGETGWDDVR
jgi:hypothetical protein